MRSGVSFVAVRALLRMFPISNSGQVVLAEVRLIRGRGVPQPRLCAQRGLTLDAPADTVPRPRLGARGGVERDGLTEAQRSRPAWVRAEGWPRDSLRHRANCRWLGGLRGRAESSATPFPSATPPRPPEGCSVGSWRCSPVRTTCVPLDRGGPTVVPGGGVRVSASGARRRRAPRSARSSGNRRARHSTREHVCQSDVLAG